MSSVIYDPIEESAEYKDIKDIVNLEVEKQLESQGVVKGRGYIHKFWELKKKILKEEYNIEWKTPAEMNPQMQFD